MRSLNDDNWRSTGKEPCNGGMRGHYQTALIPYKKKSLCPEWLHKCPNARTSTSFAQRGVAKSFTASSGTSFVTSARNETALAPNKKEKKREREKKKTSVQKSLQAQTHLPPEAEEAQTRVGSLANPLVTTGEKGGVPARA